MRIGAVLGKDHDTIVALPDGPVAAIVDTDSGQVTPLPNPARSVRQGRRAVVTRLFLDGGVRAVLTVPGAFCKSSHELAQRHDLEFIPVEVGTRLSTVLSQPDQFLKRRVKALPVEMLVVHVGPNHRQVHGEERPAGD